MADSPSEIRVFRSIDGYEFRYRRWKALQPELGKVVALHGIQSHSGWYDYSSCILAEAGFDVHFLDRRGTGMNWADRGHADDADQLVDDVVQYLGSVRSKQNGEAGRRPITLLGISWGGKLAVAVAARRPDLVDGLVLLYPGIKSHIRPSWFQRGLLNLGMAAGKERQQVPIPLHDPVLFTSDPKWQKYIQNDELALREATVGFFAANSTLDRRLDGIAANIRCPILMMLAGRDQIIDNFATKRYMERITRSRKTIITWEDAAHTLEFEPNREEIFIRLADWLTDESNRGAREPSWRGARRRDPAEAPASRTSLDAPVETSPVLQQEDLQEVRPVS